MPKRNSVEVKRVVVGGSTENATADIVSVFYLVPWIFERIRALRGLPIFSPLDQTLLEYLTSRLTGETRTIVETQIAETNTSRTMHYGNKSETIMGQYHPFRITKTRSKMFCFESEEVIFATVKFKCKKKKYAADFVLLHNVLFMIEYNRSTKEITEEREIEILSFDLDSVPVDMFGSAIPE